jgi:hypothetical protein
MQTRLKFYHNFKWCPLQISTTLEGGKTANNMEKGRSSQKAVFTLLENSLGVLPNVKMDS